MSEQFGVVKCNLCLREYKKYDKREKTMVHGLSLKRSSTYSQVLAFVDLDKSEINKHICCYCIADIVNKFEV